MKKIFFPLLFFVLVFDSFAFSQGTSPALENIVSKLKTLSANFVIEKAYLQFDKPYYAAGDTMYFKSYVVEGDHHTLSKVSGILHVDLINPQNVIIHSILLQLNNGLAAGDFSLPDSLQGGAYRVRAYTRYMQNTPEYFFDKTVPVTSADNNAGIAGNARQSVQPDIQFFPEGGNLVTSLITRVAFKAIGANGMSIDAKGVVVDNTNTPVATFTSGHLGMGSFYIQAEAGKTYTAKVTFGDGSKSTVDLPAQVAKGITLQVKDTLDKVSINIISNKAYFEDNQNKEINLIIYSGRKLSKVNTKLDSRVLGMDIPDSQFPSGVMQITLFSQDGEPLSERLVFLENPDLLNITVTSNKPVYKTRGRVEINLNAKSNNVAAPGFFSVAVVDESKVPYDDNDETTILSDLLMTSELKGYIEKPNYYFANKTGKARTDLDNLMLTQGYRRFSWKQLLSDGMKPFTFAPEASLYVIGAEKTSSGTPVANKDVIFTKVPSGDLMTTKTDDSGKFLFDHLPPFYDGTTFLLQATGSAKDKTSTVITVEKQSELPVGDDIFAGNTGGLSNVFPGKAERGSGEFGTNGEQEINGDDISGAASLTAALGGRLNGVDFVSGVPYLKGLKYPMLIVLDGKIRSSFIKLDDITVSNVKSVELLKGTNANIYGANGSSGVLVINTRYGTSGIDLRSQNNNYKYQSRTEANIKNSEALAYGNANYRSSNIGGPGHADQVVHGDEIKDAPNLSSGLNGRVRGVNFVSGIPYLVNSTVISNGAMVAEPMYVVVDGVPSAGSIDVLNPITVETVEVLKGANASIYGVNGGSGVLVITTRSQMGAEAMGESSIGSLQFKPKGFYKAREFYCPKYDASVQPGNGPDLRSTVYWNPNLTTDNDGNASFEFYNADGKGSYRVIVEGIDSNGNLGSQVYRYKVE